MLERIKDELLSIERFVLRLIKYFFIGTVLLFVELIPGIVVFQIVNKLNAPQSLINAISLFRAVVSPYKLVEINGKTFTAIYRLFVETVFFLSMATLLAPMFHWGFIGFTLK